MQADAVKLWFTYLTALIMVIGGGAMLWFSRLDPPESASTQLQLVVAGFVGAATQFLFNRETQTSTARQTERGIAQGAASQPTVTTGGNPPTTTVTPSEATA